MAETRPDRVCGPGHDDFWAGCDEGELRLQRCGDCGRVSWPVMEACDYCRSTNLAFHRMSGRGKVVSWCTFERDYNQGLLPVPWDTILVELEEGAMFVSNPRGFTAGDCRLDMPVKVAFLDAEDSRGEFRLPVFEKA